MVAQLDTEYDDFKQYNNSIISKILNSTPVLYFRTLLEIALLTLTFYQCFYIMFGWAPFSSDFLLAFSITEVVSAGLKVFFQLPFIWFPVIFGRISIKRAYFDLENRFSDVLFFLDMFTSTVLNVFNIIGIIDCPAATSPFSYVNLGISGILLISSLVKKWPNSVSNKTRIVWTLLLIIANIVPCIVIGIGTTNHHCYVATCSSLIKEEKYQFVTGKFAPITYDTHDWTLSDDNPINNCPFKMYEIKACNTKYKGGYDNNNNTIPNNQWNITSSLFTEDPIICLQYNAIHYDGDTLSEQYQWVVNTDNFLINYCQPYSTCDTSNGDFQIAPMSCDKSWICNLEPVSPESLKFYNKVKKIFD